VEILQNCNIFNDGAWESLTEKDRRDDHTIAISTADLSSSARTRTRGSGGTLELEGGGARQRVSEERPHRPRRAEPESRLRLPSLAHGRDAGLPDPRLGVLRAVDAPRYERG